MRHIWVSILWLLIGSINMTQAEGIPYISYYDETQNQLIIERADGSDSHIFPDLLPETHNRITIESWSPSGRWFILSSRLNGEGVGPEGLDKVQLIRTDDSQRIFLGSYLFDGFNAIWSPGDDMALVISSNLPEGMGNITLKLWSTEQATTLVEYTIVHDDLLQVAPLDFIWSANGENISVIDQSHTPILILHRSGQIDTQPLSYSDLSIDAGQNSAVSEDLPSPQYEWFSGPSLIRREIATGEEIEIQLPAHLQGSTLFPSPNGSEVALDSIRPTVINQHGEIVVQPFPSSIRSDIPSRAYRWHPWLPWVMLDDKIANSGGGGGPIATVVFNLNGTVWRELPVGGNVDFVPERALIYLASEQES